MSTPTDAALTRLVDLVAGGAGEAMTPPLTDRRLDDSSEHDFLSFEYLLNPADALQVDAANLSAWANGYLHDLNDSGASQEVLLVTSQVIARAEAVTRDALAKGLGPHASTFRLVLATNAALGRLYGRDRTAVPDLVEAVVEHPSAFLWTFLHLRLRQDAQTILDNALGFVTPPHVPDVGVARHGAVSQHGTAAPAPTTAQHDWSWHDYLDEWKSLSGDGIDVDPVRLPEYPFEVFPFHSTNVGIAVTYRQRWTLLGTQTGEIVRTIPLGPGQSEKVSTKVSRRDQRQRTAEQETEIETSQETSDTTKDSTDVVREASKELDMGLEAEVSYGSGGLGWGGKVSGHVDRTTASSTKETTSSLSEAMRSTAQRMKRRSRVEVATEAETAFERTSSSEIRNTNDAVAVTYIYHALQRQYEVHTRLAEVSACIFVAEALPLPHEVDTEWVRRHGHILARALQDRSFHRALTEVVSEPDEPEPDGRRHGEMLDEAQEAFASFAVDGVGGEGSGLAIPDIYAEPQRLYAQHEQDRRAGERRNAARLLRRERLFEHFRTHILHYCTAIWLDEGPDQRLLRYRKEARTIPLTWTATSATTDELGAHRFTPDDATVAVADVIEPGGPIGTFGNYLIFALRRTGREALDQHVAVDVEAGTVTLPLQDVLDLLRAPYADASGTLVDPARESFVDDANDHLAATSDLLRRPPDALVHEIASYVPTLAAGRIAADGTVLRDDDALELPLTIDDYVDFLMRRDATRRVAVDSDNVYLSLHVGSGVALEPFKRAHRYVDVLKADQERQAMALKNERRVSLNGQVDAFDPDIAKVVVTSRPIDPDIVAGALAGDDPA